MHFVALVSLYVSARAPVHYALESRAYTISLLEPEETFCDGVCALEEPSEPSPEPTEDTSPAEPRVTLDSARVIQLPRMEAHEHTWILSAPTGQCPNCGKEIEWKYQCAVPDCVWVQSMSKGLWCCRKWLTLPATRNAPANAAKK